MFHLAQEAKIVDLLPPAADAAGRTSAKAISMKNSGTLFLVAFLNQGNAATILLTPMQATSVGKANGKVLTANAHIWADLDAAASDALVQAADAANYTTDVGVKEKVVVFQITPDQLDVAGGFDHVYLSTGASNAANITSAIGILVDQKFAGPNSATALA